MKVARNASGCVCISRQHGAVGAMLVLRTWQLHNTWFREGLFRSNIIVWTAFPLVVGVHSH